MKKWIISVFTFLLICNVSFGQLKREDFRLVGVERSCFNLYTSQSLTIIPNTKSGKPPIIETSSDKVEKKIITKEGEMDIGKHRWEEIPLNSGEWYSQKYWDAQNNTYYRVKKPLPQPVSQIQYSPIIQSPVYNEISPIQPTFIPQQQLQYIQPTQSFNLGVGMSMGFGRVSSGSC